MFDDQFNEDEQIEIEHKKLKLSSLTNSEPSLKIAQKYP